MMVSPLVEDQTAALTSGEVGLSERNDHLRRLNEGFHNFYKPGGKIFQVVFALQNEGFHNMSFIKNYFSIFYTRSSQKKNHPGELFSSSYCLYFSLSGARRSVIDKVLATKVPGNVCWQ